jgi:hypothetical protein
MISIKHMYFSSLCGMHGADMYAVIADMHWLFSNEIHSCSKTS